MNKGVISGFLWRFAERCGAQGVNFIVSILLARLLAPDHYGTIAIVSVFISILNVFVDSGMGNALIQKKDADDLDFSTVFYFNFAACVVLYLAIFLAAPVIAGFYGDPQITGILRVLSITVLISGVKNIQQAYVSRNLLFKRFFYSTLAGTIGAAVVGISMAYMGFGVWALAAQQIFNTAIDTCVLWITVKWRPKRMFSVECFRELFSFGWKLLVSGLLDTAYNNVRQLIIGKMNSSADLAYYNRGKQIPNLLVTNINNSIDSVLLPTMSAVQEQQSRVRAMTKRAVKVSSYLLWPVMVGLAAAAPALVRVLLTDKWMGAVPYLRIFCLSYAFWPVHTANLNAMKAMGRSDLFLRLEIGKKVLGVTILLVCIRYGPVMLAFSLLVESILCTFINAWPNKKLIGYGYLEQVRDLLPVIGMSASMGAVVLLLSGLRCNDFLLLTIQAAAGIAVYLLESVVFRPDSFLYLRGAAGRLVRKRPER